MRSDALSRRIPRHSPTESRSATPATGTRTATAGCGPRLGQTAASAGGTEADRAPGAAVMIARNPAPGQRRRGLPHRLGGAAAVPGTIGDRDDGTHRPGQERAWGTLGRAAPARLLGCGRPSGEA